MCLCRGHFPPNSVGCEAYGRLVDGRAALCGTRGTSCVEGSNPRRVRFLYQDHQAIGKFRGTSGVANHESEPRIRIRLPFPPQNVHWISLMLHEHWDHFGNHVAIRCKNKVHWKCAKLGEWAVLEPVASAWARCMKGHQMEDHMFLFAGFIRTTLRMREICPEL